MEILRKRWKIILYGFSGLGINMLNMIVGVHLCSALLVGGFDEHIENWTYMSKDLIVPGLWAILALAAKVFDGLIDLPISSFSDRIRSRFGRRRPAILMGFFPMIAAYVLFLFPLNNSATMLNTVWFAVLLGVFYLAYTTTMLNFYATFAEILDNDRDRVLLSNVKSISDVVYFSLNFALVPLFVSMGVNVRMVALIFLPLALTMMIPMFLIKEKSTKDSLPEDLPKPVSMMTSLKVSLKNRPFIYWLCVHGVMNIGLQLFLGGVAEFCSHAHLNQTIVMAASFAPIPFTLMLYNHFVKKKGLRFGVQLILAIFSLGMVLLYFSLRLPENLMLYAGLVCAVIVSFSIGAFFSVGYTIPSQLAAEANQKTGMCTSTMFFAVQGLFEAVATGFATHVVLTWVKVTADRITIMPLLVVIFCALACFMAVFLPKGIAYIGKENKEVQ